MRTLVLKRETLTELATEDLRQVVGAGSIATVQATAQANNCVGDLLSVFGCYSWHTEEC